MRFDPSYRPCVGVMLANAAGQVFVGQRADRADAAWQMPQGGIDDDEAPLPAALRELTEETGITPDLVRIEGETTDWLTYDFPSEIAAARWKGKYRGQAQKWFLVRFLGRDDQIDLATEHPEFTEWQWVSPEDVLERIVPFKREVYARVLEEFGGLL